MSKANYGTNSSGTGSFPNVITVNMIIVQMNVNSSTIIVQVEILCVSLNKPPTFHSPGCDVAVSPQLFVLLFLFLILSGLCHINSCRTKMHHLQLKTKNKVM